jgi:23S rRNA pseudouridine1911/1915/1917 synthase
MKALEYIADIDGDVTLKEYLPSLGLSVTLIKKIKQTGIFIDGVPCTVRGKLKNGSKIKLLLPEEKSEGIPPIDLPLNIVYEDESILVIDKPKNMPTHPSKGNNLPTLANGVMAKFDGNFVFRAVNRLDRDTSGLVLIAKDEISAYKLSSSMKRGLFTKKYLCKTDGIPSPREGRIEAPIRRLEEGNIKRVVAPDGKPAITKYRVIDETENGALCEIELFTGRTHQIRVHMAHIGTPLHDDFLYGKECDGEYFLRCVEIGFPHPITNEFINIKV